MPLPGHCQARPGMVSNLSFMILKRIPSSDLNWSLDFSPEALWPQGLPLVAVNTSAGILVVAGFERKIQNENDVLLLTSPLDQLMAEIWIPEELKPLERIRFFHVLGRKTD